MRLHIYIFWGKWERVTFYFRSYVSQSLQLGTLDLALSKDDYSRRTLITY